MLPHLSLLIVVICILYYYFIRNYNYWKCKNVKGPKPIPFFGNFKNVALRKQHMGMLYSEIYEQYPEEKVVGIYRMTSPALLIRDLDIVKQILVKDLESFPERGIYFSEEGLGQTLFHSDVETWKILRNRFSSVFTPSKFKGTFHLLVDRANKLTDNIENLCGRQPEQDVYQMLLKHTIGLTMVAVFGLDVDTANNTRAFELFDEHLTTTHSNELDMLFPGCLPKLNLSVFPEVAIKFCHEIVKVGIRQVPFPKSELNNTMDILMNMRKEGDIYMTGVDKVADKAPFLKITDSLLAAQVWILYVAGYGNTTLALTYAMYHLAHNPNVQDKLIEEIDTIMDKYNGQLTYDIFNEMKYVGMVFEETLRMHPLTNAVVRSAGRDIKLEGTDLVVEKGTSLIMSPYGIQHDEKYYPEPERFNPDRFLPENVKNRHTCAFISFGAGRRSCIGSRLARILFGVCLARIFSTFRVETSNNTISSIKYAPKRMLLSPEQTIFLKLGKRDRIN